MREQRTKTDFERQSYKTVGTMLLNISRLLDIEASGALSSQSQVATSSKSHNRYIAYFRTVLMSLPGIFVELVEDVKQGRYFDQWLHYLYNILRNMLRGFRPSDLFLVWKEGGLLARGAENKAAAGADDDEEYSNLRGLQFDVSSEGITVPAAIQKKHETETVMASKAHPTNGRSSGGALSSKLRAEKNCRSAALGQSASTIDSRHSRFGGVYVRNLGNPVVLAAKPKPKPKPEDAADAEKEKADAADKNTSSSSTDNPTPAPAPWETGTEAPVDSGSAVDPMSGTTMDQQAKNDALTARPVAYVRRGVQIGLPTALPQAISKKSKDFASDQLGGGGMQGNCLEEDDVQVSLTLNSLYCWHLI